MKHIVLLILALMLLIDLAEDGCLGKANFYLPSSSAKSSITSFYHSDHQNFPSSSGLPSADWWEANVQWPVRSVTPGLQLALKIIACCNMGSAGGIPL
jgi:hypothetical protein